MKERLASLTNPSLILLNYDPNERAVKNVYAVPKHFFVIDVIEERKPLGSTARRAGWIGCNILLNEIPEAGKISIVRDGAAVSKDVVLRQWEQTRFLRNSSEETRGWLLEVMKCVEKLGKEEFTLGEMYSFDVHLSRIYPHNQNIRPKIRQQLQVLRDSGYLEFLGAGRYRIVTV